MSRNEVSFRSQDTIEQCVKTHDITTLSKLHSEIGGRGMDRYDAMYYACRIGCFESFKFLLSCGLKPKINHIDWASKGDNEHQKAIFEYAINKFRGLEYEHRNGLAMVYAYRYQRTEFVTKVTDLVLKRMQKKGELDTFAEAFVGCLTNAVKFNNPKNTQLWFDYLNEHDYLLDAILRVKQQNYAGNKDALRKTISHCIFIATKKRSLECLAIIAKYTPLGEKIDFSDSIKKSYSDEKIKGFFDALRIEERHSVLEGMIKADKVPLVISLFESIPICDLPDEPYPLSLLLSPLIRAHDTDPMTFLSKEGTPESWLSTLPILIAPE